MCQRVLTLAFKSPDQLFLFVTDHDIPTVTKPPVPISSSSSNSRASPRATSSNEKSSTSTDASDPAPDAVTRTLETRLLSKGLVPELAEPSQGLRGERDSRGQGRSGARPSADGVGGSLKALQSLSPPPARPGTDSIGGSLKASQSLSPPPAPLLGQGSPIPSPLQGLSLSPRTRAVLGDLPDVISVTDGECCRLGQLLFSCYGFSREGGVTGVCGVGVLGRAV